MYTYGEAKILFLTEFLNLIFKQPGRHNLKHFLVVLYNMFLTLKKEIHGGVIFRKDIYG